MSNPHGAQMPARHGRRGPVVGMIALGVVVVAALLASRYGWHRDELYFVVAGSHPALGYVDQPPLTPLIARALYLLGDGSLTVVRLAPALAAGGVVLALSGLAGALGGGRRARVFSALAVVATPALWTFAHLLSTATIDLLLWSLVLLAVAWATGRDDPRWWWAVGALGGFAFQNKHTVVLLALALAAGLVAERHRHLKEPALWGGLALALLIAAPNLWWQASHGWPQVEMAGSLRAEHGGVGGAVEALGLLALTLNPFLLPVVVRGWRWTRSEAGRRWRYLSVAAPTALVLQLLAGGQFYYSLPLLLVLLIAGVVATVEASPATGAPRPRRLLAAAGVVTVLTAPLALPILPRETVADLGLTEVNETIGDQIGWPELVATVRSASSEVPADRVVLTANYGEAAALQLAGVDGVYSGHNTYALWGPPPESRGATVVTVGYLATWLGEWCVGPRPLATVEIPFGIDNEEDGRPVLVCHRTVPWAQVWPDLRHAN